jgi:class 3 adenylate cyclase
MVENRLDHMLTVKGLRFPRDIELLFREDYWHNSVGTMQLGLGLGLVMYAAFGVLGAWVMPISVSSIWFIRFVVVLPVVATVFTMLFFPRLRAFMQAATAVVGVVAGLGIVAMIYVSQHDELGHSFYFVGLLIVLMYVYSFLRLRFRYAISACFIIICGYEFVAIYRDQLLSSPQGVHLFVTNNFFFLSANIVGIFTSYSLEYYARRDFLQRRLVDQFARSALRRFLPPSLVDRVITGKLRIDGEPKSTVLTVLFSDLVGFTPMTEHLRAQRTARMLNEYWNAMTGVIFRHGGTVEKFIGDAIMVIFGALVPTPPSEQAQQAAACAFEMQEELARLNDGWQHEALPVFRMRIGIHQGPAVVGNLGSEERSHFAAVGSTLNIASRIEGTYTPGAVFVSAVVADYLPENRIEEVGLVELKGLQNKVSLYRLVAGGQLHPKTANDSSPPIPVGKVI